MQIDGWCGDQWLPLVSLPFGFAERDFLLTDNVDCFHRDVGIRGGLYEVFNRFEDVVVDKLGFGTVYDQITTFIDLIEIASEQCPVKK